MATAITDDAAQTNGADVSIVEQRPPARCPDGESGRPHWHDVRASATPWEPPSRPTTVVVPHPDDEALLFGGLFTMLRRRAIRCDVIAVTDGEAAYDGVDPRALAARRRHEQAASFDILGVDATRVRRLGLPDGEVAEYCDALTDAIVECGNPVVVAPWQHDHHCDHEACGRAARRAAGILGADVYGGMFWAWHHTPVRRSTATNCERSNSTRRTASAVSPPRPATGRSSSPTTARRC